MDKAQPYFGLGRNPNSAISQAPPIRGLQVGPLRSPVKLINSPLQGHAEHADVRTKIEYLPPKGSPPKVSQYLHPFKLIVSDGDLYVNYGVVNSMAVVSDASSEYIAFLSPHIPGINGGACLNHPEGLTVDYISLSSSTTYGIWIELTSQGDSNLPAPSGDAAEYWRYSSYNAGVIIASSDYPDPSDASALVGASSGRSYIYIGKVELDGTGAATITQWLRSDVISPSITLTTQMAYT